MTDPNHTPSLETALEHSVQALDIPPRPRILDRIRAEMNADAPDFKMLGNLINADVALAAGLIKTANAPFFGLRSRARSAHEALLMLGLDVSCRAVAAISLRRAFPNGAQYLRFWDASAKIAALSGWLASRLGTPQLRPDDAWTFGLFRDCGIVILLRRFPDYGATLQRANQEAGQGFTAVERGAFPTDHSVVGGLLAQNWWLPDTLCQAIRLHHEVSAMEQASSPPDATSSRLIALSQTAEHLLQSLSGACQTQEWPKLGPACLRTLHLQEADMPALLAEAQLLLQQLDSL